MALGVSASSFHADAATEARGRFTEAAFIKPASRPRYPSGSEQRDREERGPVAGNSSGESWLSWVVKRGKDLEALMEPGEEPDVGSGLVHFSLQELLGRKNIFPSQSL